MSIKIDAEKSQYKVLTITQDDLDRGWMDLNLNSKTPASVFYQSKEIKPESNQNEDNLINFVEDDSISNSYYISGSKIYFKPENSYGAIDPETLYYLTAYDVETYTYFLQKGDHFYKYKDDILEEFFHINNIPVVDIRGMNKVFIKVSEDGIKNNRKSFTHTMKQGSPVPLNLPTSNYEDARRLFLDINGDYYIYSISEREMYKLSSDSENFEFYPKLSNTLPSYVIMNAIYNYHPDNYDQVISAAMEYIDNNLAELQTNIIPQIRNGYQIYTRENIVISYTIYDDLSQGNVESNLEKIPNHIYSTTPTTMHRFYYNTVDDLPPFLQNIFNDIITMEDIALSEKLHVLYSPTFQIEDLYYSPHLTYKTSEYVETTISPFLEALNTDFEYVSNLEPPYKGQNKTLDYHLFIDHLGRPLKDSVIDKSIKVLSTGMQNFRHISYLKTNTGKVIPIYSNNNVIIPPRINLDTEKKSFTYENIDFQVGDKILIKNY